MRRTSSSHSSSNSERVSDDQFKVTARGVVLVCAAPSAGYSRRDAPSERSKRRKMAIDQEETKREVGWDENTEQQQNNSSKKRILAARREEKCTVAQSLGGQRHATGCN